MSLPLKQRAARTGKLRKYRKDGQRRSNNPGPAVRRAVEGSLQLSSVAVHFLEEGGTQEGMEGACAVQLSL